MRTIELTIRIQTSEDPDAVQDAVVEAIESHDTGILGDARVVRPLQDAIAYPE